MTDDLTAHAGVLREEVPALRLEVKQLRERTERAEKVSMHAIFAIVVLLVLLVGVGWNVYQQHETAQRLEDLTQRAFCPLYSLILGSYSPERRLLNPDGSYPGSEREKYDKGFTDPGGLNEQYGVLGCTGALLPKMKG